MVPPFTANQSIPTPTPPRPPPAPQSIKPYMQGDDDFSWNHGLTLAALGRHGEAAGQLLAVRSDTYRWAHCLSAQGPACTAFNLQSSPAMQLQIPAPCMVQLQGQKWSAVPPQLRTGPMFVCYRPRLPLLPHPQV
jgi:hypothetical protein